MRKSPGPLRVSSPQWDFTISECLSDERITSPQHDFTILEDWVMRKSPRATENLIVAAGFYNSKCLSDEKIFRDPEILIAAAIFYNSKCLIDEKIFRGP